MAAATTSRKSLPLTIRRTMSEPPEGEYEHEQDLCTKAETCSSNLNRLHDELASLDDNISSLRGILFAEGEAKAEGKTANTSVEAQISTAVRKVQSLNNAMRSILSRV
jgi:hypothetical protein